MIDPVVTDAAFRCANIHIAHKTTNSNKELTIDPVENVYINSANVGSSASDNIIYNHSRLAPDGAHRIRWCGYSSAYDAANGSRSRFTWSNSRGEFRYKDFIFNLGSAFNIHDVRLKDDVLYVSATEYLGGDFPESKLYFVDLTSDTPTPIEFGIVQFTGGNIVFTGDDKISVPLADYDSLTIPAISESIARILHQSVIFSLDCSSVYFAFEVTVFGTSPPGPEPASTNLNSYKNFFLDIPLIVQELSDVEKITHTRNFSVVSNPSTIIETENAWNNGVYGKTVFNRNFNEGSEVIVHEDPGVWKIFYKITSGTEVGAFDFLGEQIIGQHFDDLNNELKDIVLKPLASSTINRTLTISYAELFVTNTPPTGLSGSVNSTADIVYSGTMGFGVYLKDSMSVYEFICESGHHADYSTYSSNLLINHVLDANSAWQTTVVDNYQVVSNIAEKSSSILLFKQNEKRIYAMDLYNKVSCSSNSNQSPDQNTSYSFAQNGNTCSVTKHEIADAFVCVNGVETTIEDSSYDQTDGNFTVFPEELFGDDVQIIEIYDVLQQFSSDGYLGSIVGIGNNKHLTHINAYRDSVEHPNTFDDKVVVVDSQLNTVSAFLEDINGGVDFSVRMTSSPHTNSSMPLHFIIGAGD